MILGKLRENSKKVIDNVSELNDIPSKQMTRHEKSNLLLGTTKIKDTGRGGENTPW